MTLAILLGTLVVLRLIQVARASVPLAWRGGGELGAAARILVCWVRGHRYGGRRVRVELEGELQPTARLCSRCMWFGRNVGRAELEPDASHAPHDGPYR